MVRAAAHVMGAAGPRNIEGHSNCQVARGEAECRLMGRQTMASRTSRPSPTRFDRTTPMTVLPPLWASIRFVTVIAAAVGDEALSVMQVKNVLRKKHHVERQGR